VRDRQGHDRLRGARRGPADPASAWLDDGSPRRIFDYEKIFAARPGRWRIYPDLPGMGRSVAKAGLSNQDDVLDSLLAFVDQVLPGRFVLAGTSLGAYLARAIAARRRSSIAGLLLRVPCIFAEDARRTLPPFEALVADEAFMASLDADDRAYLGDLLIQTPAYAESLKHKGDAVVQPAIQATAPIANEIRADPKRYGFSFDLIEAEKTFDEPTLIIAGRRDTTVGYRDAWSILDSYPRAHLRGPRSRRPWLADGDTQLAAGPGRRLAGAYRAGGTRRLEDLVKADGDAVRRAGRRRRRTSHVPAISARARRFRSAVPCENGSCRTAPARPWTYAPGPPGWQRAIPRSARRSRRPPRS
jgi:pimeloyl-ACP methyl ester carboxylesterase